MSTEYPFHMDWSSYSDARIVKLALKDDLTQYDRGDLLSLITELGNRLAEDMRLYKGEED
jgi:hypothetical protein